MFKFGWIMKALILFLFLLTTNQVVIAALPIDINDMEISVTWVPCTIENKTPGMTAECANISVPLRWEDDDDDSPKINLAIKRVKHPNATS